jgi:hypothetical protein
LVRFSVALEHWLELLQGGIWLEGPDCDFSSDEKWPLVDKYFEGVLDD